jgi:hypothetical protein
MSTPGLALRHLLVGALIWRNNFDCVPQTVIDIVVAANPADDVAIVLGEFNGDEELVAIPVRKLLTPYIRIEASDAAWVEYRARAFKADLVLQALVERA